MLKQLSLYDILGVLAPGAVLVIGIMTIFPSTTDLFTRKSYSVGDFGVLLLASYISGNLVAALGNLLEPVFLKLAGGHPTERALADKGVIRPREHVALAAKVLEVKLLSEGEELAKLTPSDRRAIGAQLYTYVEGRNRTKRIDLFNAQFGMNRGIAAAFVALIGLELLHRHLQNYQILLVLAVLVILAIYRMNRFSRYYTTELVRQFLQAPEKVEPTKAPRAEPPE